MVEGEWGEGVLRSGLKERSLLFYLKIKNWSMKEIRQSKDGIEHLHTVLFEKTFTVARASLWKIPHKSSGIEEVSLKIGRYKKQRGPYNWDLEVPESESPKSELTLSGDEFTALIQFLENQYEPFQRGISKFIPLDEPFEPKNIEHLQMFFSHPGREELIQFVLEHNIIPQEMFTAFAQVAKIRAIEEFEGMLDEDLLEQDWQRWFQHNSWVLGTEFVQILDERNIDTQNITDFLMQAYDGFIDIIEIKRPDGSLKFWADSKDHGNIVPHQDLVKAITQASKYIYEVEREANSVKFLEKVGYHKVIKPRCILIFGRSFDWDDVQRESYRILNSNYHNLTIITYDQILERGKRMLK